MSLPVRGAWIEIADRTFASLKDMSLPVRGAWIEIGDYVPQNVGQQSLPVRGAWIEIILEVITMENNDGRSP